MIYKFVLFFLIAPLSFASIPNHQQVKYEARIHLDNYACEDARRVLSTIKNRYFDADLVMLNAEVYDCLSFYFMEELDVYKINPSNFLRSLAADSTGSSANEVVNNPLYDNLYESIKILKGNIPAIGSLSTMDRIKYFGPYKARLMNEKLLKKYLLHLRNDIRFYGNVDADGIKGNGAQSNSCFYNYQTQDAVDWVTHLGGFGQLGSCTAATGTEGSELLNLERLNLTEVKHRMCRVIVSINNIIDITENMGPLSMMKWGELEQLPLYLITMYTAAEAAETTMNGGIFNDGSVAGQNALAQLSNELDQASCETQTLERLEKYFAIFLESLHQ